MYNITCKDTFHFFFAFGDFRAPFGLLLVFRPLAGDGDLSLTGSLTSSSGGSCEKVIHILNFLS